MIIAGQVFRSQVLGSLRSTVPYVEYYIQVEQVLFSIGISRCIAKRQV